MTGLFRWECALTGVFDGVTVSDVILLSSVFSPHEDNFGPVNCGCLLKVSEIVTDQSPPISVGE